MIGPPRHAALPDRRTLLLAAGTALLLGAQRTLPRLGMVTEIAGKDTLGKNTPGKLTPEIAIARVHAFHLPTCQVHVGALPDMKQAKPLREALDKYQVEATALMTLGPGKTVWDFYHGPSTIGLVPPTTRQARIDALKTASDLAKASGVAAVHTHCGFIPEDPNLPLYEETVTAIRDIALHCKANSQMFLMETGQESPITMARAIRDADTGNIGVNLDVANLILYGKGEPVGALDVLGPQVRGVHAKDGHYPTDPKELGKEVAIGKGRVPFPAVFEMLRKLNYTGPITIEREISGTQQEADIRASIQFLSSMLDSTYQHQ